MKKLDDKSESFKLARAGVSGFAWLLLSSGGQYLTQLISLVVLSRLLTPHDFGVVTASVTILFFVSIITQLGVGPALVQKRQLSDEDRRTAFTLSILIGSCLALFVYISATAIGGFFRIVELKYTIPLVSVAIILASFSVVAESNLQRRLKFKILANINLVTFVIANLLVSIPLALLGFSYWSILIANVVQIISKLLILIYLFPSAFRIGYSRESARELFSFGLGFTLGRFFNYIAGQGDNFVVARVLGAESLGLYSRAYQVMTLPAQLIGTVLDKVMFPIMASIQNDKERLRLIFVAANSISSFIAIPVSIFFVLFSSDIIRILLGSQWGDAAAPLAILSLFLVFRLNYKFSDSLARALGAVYNRAWRQLIFAVMVIGLAYLGTWYGLVGVALGIGVSIFFNYLLMLSLSRKLLTFDYFSILLPVVKHVVINLPIAMCLIIVSLRYGGSINIFYLLLMFILQMLFVVIISYIMRRLIFKDEVLALTVLLGSFPRLRWLKERIDFRY